MSMSCVEGLGAHGCEVGDLQHVDPDSKEVKWGNMNSLRVTSSIPRLEHMHGLQAKSPVGGAHEATTY